MQTQGSQAETDRRPHDNDATLFSGHLECCNLLFLHAIRLPQGYGLVVQYHDKTSLTAYSHTGQNRWERVSRLIPDMTLRGLLAIYCLLS